MTRTVTVRYFAALADRTGCAAERVDVPPGCDVASLWTIVATRHPGLGGVRPPPLAACDLVQSGWDRPLDDVAEVAFLPPFSGG